MKLQKNLTSLFNLYDVALKTFLTDEWQYKIRV